MKTDLLTLPGVGKNMKQHLQNLGIQYVEDLVDKDPEALYARDCVLHGGSLDRCVLYVYRCAVYMAETPDPEPEKRNWWYWKE